ncbi:MAG TPA: acyl-CoA dehydrogenase family protein [Sphingopyxis sp.]|nr:acyl-CoA dehydrogenase family protein [Sphingopyxis sp.]
MSSTMEFTQEDRQLIQQQVERFFEAEYDMEKCRADIISCPQQAWQNAAEAGILALGQSPDVGGLGGGTCDWGMAMRQIGSTLSALPLLDSAILPARLIDVVVSGARREELLGTICVGTARFAWAHREKRSGNDRQFVESRFDGKAISGTKIYVIDLGNVSDFLVTARDDSGALCLLLVKPDTAGLTSHSYRLPDNRLAGELVFDQVEGELLATGCDQAIEQVLDLAAACAAAESVGAAERLLALTIDYVKTRRQFGQALGDFQVIQHRLVDGYIGLRTTRAIIDQALAALDNREAIAAQLCSAAKAQADKACRVVGETSIQLHGGIGMTDECAAGHYLKRILTNNSRFGTADWHLSRATKESFNEAA